MTENTWHMRDLTGLVHTVVLRGRLPAWCGGHGVLFDPNRMCVTNAPLSCLTCLVYGEAFVEWYLDGVYGINDE